MEDTPATTAEVRQIVHTELDGKLVAFMDKVNESITARLLHMEPSPQTKKDIQELRDMFTIHNGKLDDILKFQQNSTEAIIAVQELLAGGKGLRLVGQILKWAGGIIISIGIIKGWIKM